jgi:galactose mutarotase-like enzyme
LKTTVLKSSVLTVSLNYFGAEINSVKNADGLEFIWQAKKNIWPRHTPVLFPIVGKLKDNIYFFEGKSYELSQHGFARDKEFELIKSNGSSCVFQLRASDETKRVYPFDFIFQISYSLSQNKLITSYKVINSSTQELFFGVGAHPGFNCPLLPNENFEDYFLDFGSSLFEQTELNNGLRSTSKKILHLKENKLQLSKTLFDNDALVFENRQVNKMSLRSEKSNHSITLLCDNWPYFGIWSKKGCTEFVCLEPWFGIADKETTDQAFETKDGILQLSPGKEFNCSFSLTFS